MIKEKEFDGEMYCLCETQDEFEQFCEECGWGDSTGFKMDTGVDKDTVIGKWFLVVHGRVFVREYDESTQIGGVVSERRKEDEN